MDDGPNWVILLMYGSHEMRHTCFPLVDSGQWDPRVGASHAFCVYYQYCPVELRIGMPL